MSDLERRTKMISLRLSAVEYEFLKAQYRTYGAHNVSDMARLALQRLIDAAPVPLETFAIRLADLQKRVETLESQVALILRPAGSDSR
jgi:hypothetical protein